jgi:hypothetical protein
LIKIKEENTYQEKKGIGKIEVRLENSEIVIFDRYPIVVDSKDMKYMRYEVQKKQNDLKNHDDEKHGIFEKAKQKALEVKDTVVDTTKELSKEQKDE